MKRNNDLPPCDGDCFNCKRPVEKCRGGRDYMPTPYVKGTHPIEKIGKGDASGGLNYIKTGGRKFKNHGYNT